MTRNSMTKRKLIIDTDPGHDDALALLLLIKSGLFDIQAITTVAGNGDITTVTRNAQAILDAAGVRLPVFSGRPAPLRRKLVLANVHGASGLDGLDTSNTKFTLTGDAPERIVEFVRASPGEVSIVAIGPLSNIARAFTIDPELPQLVDQLVIMGGAIKHPGNKNRVAEFNFFVDPDAANIVMQSGAKMSLVPLDLCYATLLRLDIFRQLADGKLKHMLMPLMEHFLRGLKQYEAVDGIAAFDALAAYLLMNPSAFTVEPMDIQVEISGKLTRGMAVAERRAYATPQPNIDVAVQLDQQAFEEELIDILSR